LSKDKAGNLHVRHRLTSETGTYKDRQVVSPKLSVRQKETGEKTKNQSSKS
jgi:hypothetical protein